MIREWRLRGGRHQYPPSRSSCLPDVPASILRARSVLQPGRKILKYADFLFLTDFPTAVDALICKPASTRTFWTPSGGIHGQKGMLPWGPLAMRLRGRWLAWGASWLHSCAFGSSWLPSCMVRGALWRILASHLGQPTTRPTSIFRRRPPQPGHPGPLASHPGQPTTRPAQEHLSNAN